jgi:hypothetical protein
MQAAETINPAWQVSPSGQSEHSTAPAALKVPAAHGVHRLAALRPDAAL